MDYQIILFFIGVFFLRFPPIYFFGIKNIFLTSHFFSATIFIFLVLLNIFIYLSNKNKKRNLASDIEEKLVLLFFFTQSLSILPAINIFIFVQRYSKVLIGLIVYFLAKEILTNKIKKQIFIWLFFGFLISLIFQINILFLPNLFFDFGSLFLYKNVLNIAEANYYSGKIFDDTYLEIITPICVYYLLKKARNNKKVNNLIVLVILILTSFIAYASNFRYRLLTFLLSLNLSIIFLKKRKNIINIIKNVILIFIFTQFFLILFDRFLVNLNTHTLFDRLISEEEYEKTGTIAWRFKMFDRSIELSKYSLFGIGLGNMFDYLNKSPLPTNKFLDLKSRAALESGPHNIFFQLLAETGIVGLMTFLLMLIFFAKKDFLILKSEDSVKKTLILSFWTLIFMVQFFPSINLIFYVLFFLLRGLI